MEHLMPSFQLSDWWSQHRFHTKRYFEIFSESSKPHTQHRTFHPSPNKRREHALKFHFYRPYPYRIRSNECLILEVYAEGLIESLNSLNNNELIFCFRSNEVNGDISSRSWHNDVLVQQGDLSYREFNNQVQSKRLEQRDWTYHRSFQQKRRGTSHASSSRRTPERSCWRNRRYSSSLQ